MTMQRRPNNPIAKRKAAVRAHARRGVISVAAGTGGGIALALLAGAWTPLIVGFIIAVAGGGYSWMQIQKIVNHKDNY
ncbi:hypothetical protein CPHO_04420 [Corynebacterium phocae]|uniref:Secreted protein n=1 Tax=Corynebacterium phocae TaxID=161895 RepID=A0A1L7D2E2_9CORY|nr:hypothetical protein [Corynebacterium phocae]APT92260.1 hypothetical protein CPHO_04420 [Corynebacterium phocae]KAA8725405.1 hypothetical protein F4V58_03970 [Corynebacterium phocae]